LKSAANAKNDKNAQADAANTGESKAQGIIGGKAAAATMKVKAPNVFQVKPGNVFRVEAEGAVSPPWESTSLERRASSIALGHVGAAAAARSMGVDSRGHAEHAKIGERSL